MESVVISARMMDVIFNPSIYIRVAYGIADIMAYKTAHIGQSLFPLLPRVNPGKLEETAPEKIIHMVFVHMGTHIAVVTVAQDRQVIEKHIRPLQSQLIKPPVLGNDKL